MKLISQTWTLTKKDLLLVARRKWLSTIVRAIILPIAVACVLSYAKVWIATKGKSGIGQPYPLLSFSDALDASANTRNKFVIVDNNLTGSDVKHVIDSLSDSVKGKKDLHVVHSEDALNSLCKPSSRGVTNCYGGVQFWSSPSEGKNAIWNYTIYQDSVIGEHADITNSKSDVQVYTFAFQRAIDSAIARVAGGRSLPKNVKQYEFTYSSQADQDKADRQHYQDLVAGVLAFAFFIAICGITYHLTGHVAQQREEGLLQLIDAMMPNSRRWECQAIRTIATHFAFDLIYAPGWIAMGAVTGVVAFPASNPGWLILLFVLTGLALSSYSILASSLFRRVQLSAMSAIVTALVLAIVAQFAEAGGASTTTIGVMATAILFPPSAFVYFLITVAKLEANGTGINASTQFVSSGFLTPYTYPSISQLLGFFIFQIVVYPILGAILERVLHGKSSKSRHLCSREEMDGNSVRLRNFSKVYKAMKKKDKVYAVDDLSLNLHAGSITVLLGANGSGKSTTLNSIAGLESITSGEIEIDGTGGIGICPQKNVLWGTMTVEEHISFFERLKNPSSSRADRKAEVARLITGCDLEIKKNARAKSLSGGQMRKLQLAMMLSGGSQVCCIDEASSGIDPLARRKIWDILLQERGQRTMLLTTHFLDESEVLSDHIAVLSKGKLRAEGTVALLKGATGGGYAVVLPNQQEAQTLQRLPHGITAKHDYNDSVYNAPDAATLTPFLVMLEQRGISNYRIHGPTMESVFLHLAEEMKSESQENINDERQASSGNVSLQQVSSKGALKLNPGQGCGKVKQTMILFRKRLTVLKHNYMPYVAALFIPLTLAGLVTLFLKSTTADEPQGLVCNDPEAAEYSYNSPPSAVTQATIADQMKFGPPDVASIDIMKSLVPTIDFFSEDSYYSGSDQLTWPESYVIKSLPDFTEKIKTATGENGAFILGGFFLGESEAIMAFEEGSFSAISVQGAMNMAALNMTIGVSQKTFRSAYVPSDFFQAIIAIFTVLGFAIYPGFFALYPTAERLRNVRAMHYSNGIYSSSLWTAYSLFDMCFIALISVLATAIWGAIYHSWYGLGYMFVVFFLYGLASTAYSYVISLFAPSQLSAMAATSLVNVVLAMLFFVGYFITINNTAATEVYLKFNVIYFTMALISPSVSLLRALFVVLNVYSLACRGTQKASYPGEITLYGGPILYLTIQFILLVSFLAFWESGRSLEVFGIKSRKKEHHSEIEEFKTILADAQEDEAHLDSSNDGLRVYNISKTFGSNKAVDDVTFGILPSEKFALLGPNGAGKSTMISLLRGDLKPNSTRPAGEIYISGDGLMNAPVTAKSHLGVCPQFDAVDSMTLREHLDFYARARGVPDKDTNINELIHRLGLADHERKLVKKLSGGTRRKLSLAIALISNPSVLLLDEPSSGMDAVAKRALWATLSAISVGRCLLLTTHSMEEADALCDRAGIMARKMLALGTISDLRSRHGDKIYIHLVHKDAPYTSDAVTQDMWQWVSSTFLVAEAEPKTFGGQLRFAVPIERPVDSPADLVDGSNMGRLFRIVEEDKSTVGISDYSIGPTTLDQVFLNVVEKNNVAEENTAPATKPKGIFARLRGGKK